MAIFQVQEQAKQCGVAFTGNAVGGMFGLFFTDQPSVSCFADVLACDVPRFNRFFHAMLENGVYLAPSAYEAGFVSAAHGTAEIEATLAAADKAFVAVFGAAALLWFTTMGLERRAGRAGMPLPVEAGGFVLILLSTVVIMAEVSWNRNRSWR